MHTSEWTLELLQHNFWPDFLCSLFLIFRSSLGDDLIDLVKSGVSVHTSVRPSMHPQKSFSDFDVIWCVVDLDQICVPMLPWPDPRSRSRSQLLKFRKLHFSMYISFAIFTWSSKLMVDHDSTGPSLQLVWARFSNFLFRKLSCEFILHGLSTSHEFQMAIFLYCWTLRHMVGHARSPVCIVHHWPPEVPKTALFYVYLLLWRGTQLMGDYDTMGPSLQLFGAIFLNFSPSWRSCDFEVREMLISPESTAFYLRAGRG